MSLYEEDLELGSTVAAGSSPALREDDLDTTAAAIPQAPTQTDARIQQQRTIRPLGEQIIIRVIPPLSVGSIIIPDSAKGSTHQGEKGDLVHFVEAEVVAVGPGRRGKDSGLIEKLADALEYYANPPRGRTDLHDEAEYHRLKMEHNRDLIRRARRGTIMPLQVKPGDRILYHPAVQSFDRKIDPELLGLPASEECYICNEQTSVLAILEKE